MNGRKKRERTECDETAKQPWAQSGEVKLNRELSAALLDLIHNTYLRLKCEQCQTQEDPEGDEERLHDDDIIIEGSDHPKSKSLQERESGQKDKIPWVTVAFPEKKTKVNQSTE